MIITERITDSLKIKFDTETKVIDFMNGEENITSCTIEPFKTNMRNFLRNLK